MSILGRDKAAGEPKQEGRNQHRSTRYKRRVNETHTMVGTNTVTGVNERAWNNPTSMSRPGSRHDDPTGFWWGPSKQHRCACRREPLPAVFRRWPFDGFRCMHAARCRDRLPPFFQHVVIGATCICIQCTTTASGRANATAAAACSRCGCQQTRRGRANVRRDCRGSQQGRAGINQALPAW